MSLRPVVLPLEIRVGGGLVRMDEAGDTFADREARPQQVQTS